jgi:clorobiocin biosynthesis protein CloN6
MLEKMDTSNKNLAQDIKADLILLHAPSVYDFRKRDDIVFACSDTDSVDVTSIYEIYPMGLLSIRQHLIGQGMKAEIINVAALMLSRPDLDVDRLLSHLKAPVFGIDLQWMIHCHGSIELAKRVKAIHPDAKIIFGGITSTFYADELIRYPCVDVVVKGYDTLQPVEHFVREVTPGL